MRTVGTVFIMTFIFLGSLSARDFRVGQVPNGNSFNCFTCHNGYGGSRNDFGKEIEANYLDNSGNVVWGPELAALDSDADGGTNGTELQDPTGAWTIGDANPGDAALVTNPGDDGSVSAVAVNDLATHEFALSRNYPNPFNASTRINIEIAKAEQVSLHIYTLLGERVATLENMVLQPGTYTYVWDGQDAAGMALTSGIYLLQMRSESYLETIRMLMIK